MKNLCFLFVWTSLLLCLPICSQSNKKIRELQNKRGELQQQIKQSESLLLSTKKDVKSQLSDLALITSQIEERKKFISAIENDIKLLDDENRDLETQLKLLQTELTDKQNKYGSSVRYLRKNRSIEEKLMFIFSAQTLNQIYRRMRYVNEYATFQRVQGEEIRKKQTQVSAKRQEILAVREEKSALLAQREEERSRMETQEKQQRTLVANLRKKQRSLQSELTRKRRESQRLNAQIDNLIEAEIAAARKREQEAQKKKATAKGNKSNATKSETATKKEVPMMEAYKGDVQLSNDFVRNRGLLPIPITGPYAIVSHFGQYAVEGLKNVKLDNKGIDIQGQAGANACSIFNGEVSAIFQYSNGMKGVLIRHGNYISVYCNLASASVKKGQKIKTRDIIGPIAPDASGNTVLHFQLRKETTKLNPERWLSR
ncbi:MAG: peptidoglycan DD-metalloendopeptidase family protein [Bacteroidaceae bacterium]|nr:peptidoglycan DD-metalloendopeptidase family protein [Bacteroidaceae bacterium]